MRDTVPEPVTRIMIRRQMESDPASLLYCTRFFGKKIELELRADSARREEGTRREIEREIE